MKVPPRAGRRRPHLEDVVFVAALVALIVVVTVLLLQALTP